MSQLDVSSDSYLDESRESEPGDRRTFHRFTGALVLMACALLVMIAIKFLTLR